MMPILCCFFALLATAAAGILPDLYTFGDSLTDTGNALRISNGAFPNTTVYPKGRFTNEPGTWANHVQLRTVALKDFSVGGATACFYPDIKGKQAIFPSMAKQVAAWLNDTTRPVGKKVVVLWGGHNDIMSAVKLPPKQIPGVPKQVVTCLASMANQILAADKDATVLIASLAPINLTPLFGKVKQIQKLVNTLNKVISIEAKLLKLKYGLSRVALWDINQVLAAAVAQAPQLGFKVASSGSCVTYKVSFENFFTDLTVGPGLPCTDPNDYVFYDPLHPTSKSHGIIANSYFAKLLELKLISALPLPLP